MTPHNVFATPLALCLAILPGLGVGAQPDQTFRILDSRDAAYAAVLSDIPALAGATKIVRNHGHIERAFFSSTTPEQLRALAETLLHRVDPTLQSNLQPIPDKAAAFQNRPSTIAAVYQHRVGDIDVAGSVIITKVQKDGSGEIISALVPIQAHKIPFPHEADVMALHSAGTVRKAYRIKGGQYATPVYTTIDPASGEVKVIDAGTMKVVESNSAVKDDILPDDAFWQAPPTKIIGVDKVTNKPAVCVIEPLQVATPYYPPPYLLNPFNISVNIQGLATRLRAPSLGLTGLQFLGSQKDFMFDWPSWSASDISSIIYRHPFICQYIALDGTIHSSDDAVYPPPLDYNGDLPPQSHNLYQYLELQTAIEDIRDRFDWKGLNNAYNSLMFVQDMDRESPSCSTALPMPGHPFAKILCSADAKGIAKGLEPRIPAIETMAHEFAHTIVYDKGISDYGNSSNEIKGVAESISDMFGIYVKSKHEPGSPWAYANQPEFMQRVGEYLCANIDSDYCAYTPSAMRDIANPKTMDKVRPAPNFYYGTYYVSWDPYRVGQVLSYMEYLMADGSPGGARDDDPAKGSYDLFVGMGFEEMYEIFFRALDGLPQVQSNPLKANHEYANQLVLAAQLECGQWSYAERLTKKAQWVVNLSDPDGDFTKDVDIDLEDAGYTAPQWGEAKVPSLVKFEFVGEPSRSFEYQVATDIEFQTPVATGAVSTDVAGKATWHQKLDPAKSYWWRVRWADAPMKSSAFVDQNNACWRAPAPFTTVAASISNPSPAGQNSATGDETDAWRTVFSWTGSDQWQGYEVSVDDEENPKGRYSDFWAHLVLEAKSIPINPENPGTASAPHFILAPLPLPGIPELGGKINPARNLCWKIVPFLYDNGKRLDGDPAENCFRSAQSQTLITHPAPPSVDGTLSAVAAQPMAIDYIPAIGTDHHDFSLKLLDLSGGNAPAAEGQWAYEDNVENDPKNRVKEDYLAKDWSSRTRLRMLPVQLDDIGSGINYGLNRVRLSIVSYSPTIPAADSGGTYKPRVEKAETATVDFHPTTPANFTDFHPQVFMPPASGMCSSPDNTDMTVQWRHGSAATPGLVATYSVRLYPEPCNNASPPGCFPPAPPIDPSLARVRTVERNDGPTQSLTISRQGLFPTISDEEMDANGYFVQLYGLSGPEPGPEGLNITGTFQTDLPVLPAKLETGLYFSDDPQDPQYSNFSVFGLTSRNPDHAAAAYSHQFSFPTHHIITRLFRGEGCKDENLITSTEFLSDSGSIVFLDDPALGGDAHPIVSANVEIRWPNSMKCKVVKGSCRSIEGVNYLAEPESPENLQAHEDAGVLGFSWDPPSPKEPNSSTIYYEVTIGIENGHKPLAHPPGLVTRSFDHIDLIGSQIGISTLTYLEEWDAGKPIKLEVKACRQENELCSEKVTLGYVVGNGSNANVPNPPTNVMFHFDDPGLQQMWKDLVGVDIGPSNNWIQLSFDPPAGTTPDYYIVTFTPTGNVPGMLPTWLNNLNVAGVNFPGDPMQYSAVIRSSPGGLIFGGTPWATYVWPLAETDTAGPPSVGQILNVAVRACLGAAPIGPGVAAWWVVGPSTTQCSMPAQASVQL
jgi:hypothetical protein